MENNLVFKLMIYLYIYVFTCIAEGKKLNETEER